MEINNQSDFDNLVSQYIKENKNLFMLAFNYDDKFKLDKIEDYYIEKRDDFSLCEIISLSMEYIDMDNLFNKIIKTDDVVFIENIEKNIVINGIVDPKYLKKLNYYRKTK